ncbi:MAG: C39 family peptidase, partial [Chloroflexota bacterium]|nr:C39 family peptidase [Chloroflexota bacterium]
LWATAESSASRSLELPGAALVEVIGPGAIQGKRVHVRLPGDGRQLPPAQGWIEADALARAAAPSFTQVPRAYPATLRADVRLKVPYRTQLDGSGYASANCGPTVLGMALEAFGIDVAQPALRNEVLTSEDFDPEDDDAGSFIWALARVAQRRGLQTFGLYERDGQTLHRWSVEDVRANVRAGRPVVAQVVYRGLPGREHSEYWGDHYIVITGLMGEDFLYNDPIGGVEAGEAPGWDRLMTADELRRAMRASDRPYAYSAFGVGRR